MKKEKKFSLREQIEYIQGVLLISVKDADLMDRSIVESLKKLEKVQNDKTKTE